MQNEWGVSMFSASANAYDQYRVTAVQTASPGKLLLMLYDGLILALRQAKQALEKKDAAEAHRCLVKGQDIFSELMSTLNMDYEISGYLYKIYDYLKQRLIEANVRKEAGIIDEVLAFVTDLRNTWASIIESEKNSVSIR